MVNSFVALLPLLSLTGAALAAPSGGPGCNPPAPGHGNDVKPIKRISLGPRPYWLVDHLEEGPLKDKLASCSEKEMKPSAWSISHRGGGTLQFPEHTFDSIMAGVRFFLSLRASETTG